VVLFAGPKACRGDHRNLWTAVTQRASPPAHCVGTGSMAMTVSLGLLLQPGFTEPAPLDGCWCALTHPCHPYLCMAANPEPIGRVCFCGTVLTVARHGRYPAAWAMGSPDFPQPDPVHEPARPMFHSDCDHLALLSTQDLGRRLPACFNGKVRERKEQPS